MQIQIEKETKQMVEDEAYSVSNMADSYGVKALACFGLFNTLLGILMAIKKCRNKTDSKLYAKLSRQEEEL